MVSDADLQLWQDAVKGINELGKAELTKEEWSALTVLNGCLTNGNFQSDENRRNIKLLRDNLSMHGNNPALQILLQNFITLCEKHLNTVAKPAPIPSLNMTNLPMNSKGNTSKDSHKKNGSLWIVFVIAVALIAGYVIVSNSGRMNDFVGGDLNSNDNYILEVNIPNGSKYSADIDSVAFITDFNTKVAYNNGNFILKLKDAPKEWLKPISKIANNSKGVTFSDTTALFYVEEHGVYIYALKDREGYIGQIFLSTIHWDNPLWHNGQAPDGTTIMLLYYVDRKCEIAGSPYEGSIINVSFKKGWNKLYIKQTGKNTSEMTTIPQKGLEWMIEFVGEYKKKYKNYN